MTIGQERVRLLIDTGAYPELALSPELLARVPGVSLTGERRRFENARGETLSARMFRLAELQLGDWLVHNASGQELVFAQGFEPPNREGYLGRALFRSYRMLFDYPAQKLTLLRGPAEGVETQVRGGGPIALLSDATGLIVEATLDGEEARFVVDTAATHSFLKKKPAHKEMEIKARLGLAGRVLPDYAFHLLEGGPPGVDGILGRNLFESRQVLLDLPGQRAWIG